MDYPREFYENHCDEDTRLQSRHGRVEFLTTMRYIEKYLKPGDRIIEIVAGTGRYTHALAQKGYSVDAVELVEHNIEVFKQNTLPGEPVTVRQGNALDLSGFPDSTRLHFVGTDLFTCYMKDTIDQMDDELYELYLRYHFAVCERPDLVGASNHFLDVFRKL